jgi:uncharacterized membrane protein (Fun14 family)
MLIILGGLTLLYNLLIWAIADVLIVGWFLRFFLGMYALMVGARILGLFYRENSGIFNV